VDEAATRIREEVDQDANIILGATFDEELDGVIRVSVVATGIDKALSDIVPQPIQIRQQPKPTQQQRPADPRPVQQPIVQEARMEPRAADPVAEAIRMAEANAAEMAQPRVVPQPADDFRPQSKLFQAPAAPVQHAQPQPAPVQPAPVMQQREAPAPAPVQPRMPRVEDFPPMVKAEVAAAQAPRPAEQEDRGPMGLLKRLTNGLTRREEEPARLQPAQPREPKLRQPAPEARRLAPQDAQMYAPRRGQLDEHGRLTPQPRAAQEDDQLEIPAFLRRQAN
jgi:cell division protein FtsZ